MRRGDVLTLKVMVPITSSILDRCESAIRRVSIQNLKGMSADEILRGNHINAITVRCILISPLKTERTIEAVHVTIKGADEVIAAV